MRALTKGPDYLNSKQIIAAWETAELSLNLVAFNQWLLKQVGQRSGISLNLNAQITEIQETAGGFSVAYSKGGQAHKVDSSLVMNCLWEGRMMLDQQLGYIPSHTWLYRFKHRILVGLPPHLQNMHSHTMVLGSYGDVVN